MQLESFIYDDERTLVKVWKQTDWVAEVIHYYEQALTAGAPIYELTEDEYQTLKEKHAVRYSVYSRATPNAAVRGGRSFEYNVYSDDVKIEWPQVCVASGIVGRDAAFKLIDEMLETDDLTT